MDLFIIIVLVVGLIWGWWKGFFLQLASLVGVIVGFFIACYVYARYGDALIPEDAGVSTNAVIFLILWIGIPLALTLVAKLLGGIMSKLHLGWINHSLGAALGMVKLALFLSLLFTLLEFISKYDNNPLITEQTRQSSVLYYPVQQLAGKLLPSDFLEKATEIQSRTKNGREQREE